MRFLYTKLTGYIGLYNGLGLNEIEIDFTKSKNNITVISGPNGVGKSTIINALNIFPDGNENFVPTMNASKQMRFTDNENIYDVFITHPIDKNNNRGTTKASIQKNGVELNSNGNISSYKDIIYSEFDMDANFDVLSKISGNNRGLADKRPAERKKIMSSLISSLEVYNNIYKVLNKKANIFKSYINNLSSKIQNIGDEASLRTTLASIISRESRINEVVERAKEQITKSKTILNINDPDGSMQQKYDSLVNEINISDRSITDSFNKLSQFKDRNFQSDDIKDMSHLEDYIAEKKVILSIHEKELTSIDITTSGSIVNINNLSSELSKLKVKIDNLTSSIDNSIIDNINKYEDNISEMEDGFNGLGIVDIDSISKEEISYVITIIDKIIYMIDYTYSIMCISDFNWVYVYLSNDIDIQKEIDNINLNIMESEKEIQLSKSELSIINSDIETISVLDKRPSNCKDDKCMFVSNALNVMHKYGDTKEDALDKYQEVSKKILNLNNVSAKLQTSLSENQNRLVIISKFKEIINIIDSNMMILKKFSITQDITDRNRFLELVKNESRFNSLRSVSQYTSLSNSITEYKTMKSILQNLQAEYVVYNNNISIIADYQKEYDDKSSSLDNLKSDYQKLQKDKEFQKGLVDSLNMQIGKLETLNELYLDWCQKKDYNRDLKDESHRIEDSFNSSLKILQEISELQELINTSSSELQPISDQKRAVQTQLTLLESFQSEYAMYKEKYDFVDKLRKYSSPTQGSIQSLFMSIYMDKTLSMVNQLLGMIFGGQYRILDYVINEDEFRIPFVGNGLAVDDISSGSTSQVCIMGMIINLVLANISSSKYNIISLDEIDGGLDHVNRYMFVDVLQKICEILNIEQLFIISHSVESALANVDVVLLSDDQEYIDQFANANKIYQFKRVA